MEDRAHPRGMVALTALALLAEEPSHPYELQRKMRTRHKDYALGKTRGLYRAIEELEAAGYIEPAETSREGKRPERTVYRITGEGREELENWLFDLLERPVQEHPVFNIAIGLIACLPQPRAETALLGRSVSLRLELASLVEAGRALREDLHLPRLVLLELEHASALREAELHWVLSLLDDMKGGRLVWNPEVLRAHFQAMHDADQARRAAAGAYQESHRDPPATQHKEVST